MGVLRQASREGVHRKTQNGEPEGESHGQAARAGPTDSPPRGLARNEVRTATLSWSQGV